MLLFAIAIALSSIALSPLLMMCFCFLSRYSTILYSTITPIDDVLLFPISISSFSLRTKCTSSFGRYWIVSRNYYCSSLPALKLVCFSLSCCFFLSFTRSRCQFRARLFASLVLRCFRTLCCFVCLFPLAASVRSSFSY